MVTQNASKQIGFCDNLDGIPADYKHIKQWCDYMGYKTDHIKEKYEWTQIEILTFIQKCARDLCDDT